MHGQNHIKLLHYICVFVYLSLHFVSAYELVHYISKGRINLPTQEMVTRKYETRIKDQPQDLINFRCLECSVYTTVYCNIMK